MHRSQLAKLQDIKVAPILASIDLTHDDESVDNSPGCSSVLKLLTNKSSDQSHHSDTKIGCHYISTFFRQLLTKFHDLQNCVELFDHTMSEFVPYVQLKNNLLCPFCRTRTMAKNMNVISCECGSEFLSNKGVQELSVQLGNVFTNHIQTNCMHDIDFAVFEQRLYVHCMYCELFAYLT